MKRKLAGVLSLDSAGPFKPAYDQGGFLSRYFLVGTLTWAVPVEINVQGEEEDQERDDEGDSWPMIEEEKEKKDGEMEPLRGLTDAEEEGGEDLMADYLAKDDELEEGHEAQDVTHLAEEEPAYEDEDKEALPGGEDDDEKEGREEDQPPKDFRIEVFRMALLEKSQEPRWR